MHPAPPARSASLPHLACRQLLRDLPAGELRLLVLAVTLALAALTAVGFLADRPNHSLARPARQWRRTDALIVIEPDRGAGSASFAPRVMINQADLAATGLVQPASRVTYRLAVAATSGNDDAVRRFTDWAEAQIRSLGLRGMRVESFASGRPEM